MAVKIVKSVARVMEILELFEAEQKAMSAAEIANKLNYPVASTHEILKTFLEFGYFTYGVPKWAYKPSAQFSKVVEWVRDNLADDKELMDFMEALNQETQETINLSRRLDAQIKIFKGYECLHPFGVSSKPGTLMPATLSLTGIASLSHMSTDEVDTFLSELKINDSAQYENLNRDLIFDILSEVRREGMTMRADVMVQGIGAICCPIYSSVSQTHLVIGIVGPSERILVNGTKHKKTLKRLIRKFKITTTHKIRI